MKIKYNAFGRGRHRINCEPDYRLAIDILFAIAALAGTLILLGIGIF